MFFLKTSAQVENNAYFWLRGSRASLYYKQRNIFMTLELLSLVVSHKSKEFDSLENTLFLSINRAKNLFLPIGYRIEKLILVCPRGMMELNVLLATNISDSYSVELVQNILIRCDSYSHCVWLVRSQKACRKWKSIPRRKYHGINTLLEYFALAHKNIDQYHYRLHKSK